MEKVYISNFEDLKNCSEDDHIVLTDDISFPISFTAPVFKSFTGVLNGNNHTISNLYAIGDKKVGGLIGILKAGEIHDVSIQSAVESKSLGGGVVGMNREGVIDTVSVRSVCSGKSNIGGICGVNNGKVMNSEFKGILKGEKNIGGIAGVSHQKILNCYTHQTEGTTKGLQGESYIGGIVGSSLNSEIHFCLSLMFVDNKDIGGIAGRTRSSTITNSYNPFHSLCNTKVSYHQKQLIENNELQKLPDKFKEIIEDKQDYIIVHSM